MGCLGCSGRRFGRAGSWRGVFCAAACRVRRASVCAAGMIEPTVGVFCGAACRGSMVAKPPVVAWKGQGRVLFRWLCWLCSACLRLFVGVVWLVFVGGLGGIATIGAALRRVVGVSGVYGRKTPRVVARKGQRRVPVEGSMVAKSPSACSKCSRPRWNGGDMGCLGCSGRRFGRAGSWRGVFCAAACRVRRASVRAAGMIEPTVGVFCGAACRGSMVAKPPECLVGRASVACPWRGLWSQNPRVLAQSAVDLGGMGVTWGFWGVVDDGLGALVRGEAFSAGRRVGYLGPQCVLPG